MSPGNSSHRESTQAPADAGETFAADEVPGVGSTAATHAKVCCSCGINLIGEKRYKDAEGRYWCCDCAKTDSAKKHPAVCPDCNQSIPGDKLVEHEGMRLCPDCLAKRQASAKRTAARLAAAAEEDRLQKLRDRRTIIAAGVAVGLLVAYAAYRVFVH